MYQPFEHVGFGAGYEYVDADVDYKDDGDKTSIDGNIHGPMLFATLSFL